MKKLQNLKHIFFVSCISLVLIFVSIFLFSREFSSAINSFFVYRTSGGIWQDTIYQHKLTPSKDIVIVKIDDASLNTLQAEGNLKMLRIPKSAYANLIDILEGAGVKGIAFDIIFQNADPDEIAFAQKLEEYKNIVIAVDQSGVKNTCVADVSGEATTCE